jgi:hypothetical protein
LTGLNSTPSDGATDLDRAELADPGCYGGIPKDGRSRHARLDLFEQLQPFPGQAVFERYETGGVAARPRQAVDEAGTDRIDDEREHNWHGASRLKQLLYCAASDQNDVRREGGQFRRVFANVVGIACAPAIFDLHVTTVDPAQLLQPLPERRVAGLRVRIVRGQTG